ncbi:hypothetical protein CDD80_478 [Ophiocordyceps camponoti-rufipedis]|uniref:RRM domain-containing protein n=1 Tax=Ophiocordyceps camponoti-rufipedis TaxID=2004952 RepID=A0A2C5YK22_9HYPO|nr:hypothetical protein CDD80_478 [Ophiocordyceps camponoti-rufipedis]
MNAASPPRHHLQQQQQQHHQKSVSARASPFAFNTSYKTSTTTPPPPPLSTAAAATAPNDAGDMATAGYLSTSHAYRPLPPPYPLNMSPSHLFDSEAANPIGSPFSKSPSPYVCVLIRRLPPNTTEESLRLMVVWSKELPEVELLSIDPTDDDGFRSAILRFRSMAAATEVRNMLDGRVNVTNNAEMMVDIVSSSPTSASSSSRHHLPRFNNVFASLDKLSPTSAGAYPAHYFLSNNDATSFQNIFSSQHSPGGNYPGLTDPPRISGKSLISSDLGDDDETSDLLKDPVAYAESSSGAQRRATAPHLPLARLAGLSLNTTAASSLPPQQQQQYMRSLSPVSAPGPPSLGAYSVVGNPYQPRHNFPPVNPADQNPPCNTLYVGNLPIDTSEEELKAMFSKQRGYKRLCFRTKQNGPMCFVEFEDISFATKALHELYGHPLHNSVKGGIRLSFSKNPLGVRSGQAPGQGASPGVGGVNGAMSANPSGFTTAHGPPPGLAAPPGLGSGRRGTYNLTTGSGGSHGHHASVSAFPVSAAHAWNAPIYNNAGQNAPLHANSAYLPRHVLR